MPLGTSFGSEEHQRKLNALSVTRNIQRAYTCTGGRIQPIRVVPTGKRFAYLFRIIQYAVNIELSEIAKRPLIPNSEFRTPNSEFYDVLATVQNQSFFVTEPFLYKKAVV